MTEDEDENRPYLDVLARQMHAFLIAVQFLTRFPVPQVSWDEKKTGLSVIYYPLVGLLLGGVLAVFAATLHTAPIVLSALILAFWVWATGGLHLDGLGDTADAWACGGNRERMMAVMKEASCGPAAVSTIAILLFLKFAALTVLIGEKQWTAIMLAPMVGRLFVPVLFSTTPYVRVGGLGSAMAKHLPPTATWVAIAVAMLALFFVGVCMVLGAVCLLFVIRHAAMKKLGGITGDVVGAAIEALETLVLLIAVLSI
jgi:adenosylcobinamide-GDP ribazoletransferase